MIGKGGQGCRVLQARLSPQRRPSQGLPARMHLVLSGAHVEAPGLWRSFLNQKVEMFRLFVELCLIYIHPSFGEIYHIRCPFSSSLLSFFTLQCFEEVPTKLIFNLTCLLFLFEVSYRWTTVF